MFIIIDPTGLEMLGSGPVRTIDEQAILCYGYENKSLGQNIISTAYWRKLAIGQCWLVTVETSNGRQGPILVITFHYLRDQKKLREEGIIPKQLCHVLKKQLNLQAV